MVCLQSEKKQHPTEGGEKGMGGGVAVCGRRGQHLVSVSDEQFKKSLKGMF